ncbi:putative alpha-galactosidase a [Gossypium arboreum]|uniref:Putative alpha-galactosidase a n=1 Tax=Gossypium arboreum TaxID=29729 RepID=A0A0B0M9L8_GOSAR|nr:putative alpha-galactosidase a [Gossypium arboreum]
MTRHLVDMCTSVRPCLGHAIGNIMRASVRPCLGHGTGVDMCASVRPCLGHGIGHIMRSRCKTMSRTWHRHRMRASVRPCPGHGIDILPFCIRLIGVTDASSGWRSSEILSHYPTIEGYK